MEAVPLAMIAYLPHDEVAPVMAEGRRVIEQSGLRFSHRGDLASESPDARAERWGS
jgi:hypothetical protein